MRERRICAGAPIVRSACTSGRKSEGRPWRRVSKVPGEFLAAQRRKIYERIERPSRKYWLLGAGASGGVCAGAGDFRLPPGGSATAAACPQRRDQQCAIVPRYLFHRAARNPPPQARFGRCSRSSDSDAEVFAGGSGFAGGAAGAKRTAGRPLAKVRRCGRARGGTALSFRTWI